MKSAHCLERFLNINHTLENRFSRHIDKAVFKFYHFSLPVENSRPRSRHVKEHTPQTALALLADNEEMR